MKITTHNQLDKLNELVAKELGWRYLNLSNIDSTTGWVPPNMIDDTLAEDWITDQDWWQQGYNAPPFSSEEKDMAEVISYLHSQGIAIEIWSSPILTKVDLYESTHFGYRRGSSVQAMCGQQYSLTPNDSSFNSLPLAVAIALLKYKGYHDLKVSLEDTVN